MEMIHWKPVFAFLSLLYLAGCASTTVSRDFCLIYEPVYTSPNDTGVTRDFVDRNNAVWLELCDKK